MQEIIFQNDRIFKLVPKGGKCIHVFGDYNERQWYSNVTNVARVNVGRDSSVGKANRCGLKCPGIEFRWRRDFPHLSRPALGPTQPPIQWVAGLSWGVNSPWCGVDHPSLLAPGLKKEYSYISTPRLGLSGLL